MALPSNSNSSARIDGGRTILSGLIIVLATVFLPVSISYADSTPADCSTSYNSYVSARSNYLATSRPTNRDGKELNLLFQKAQKERVNCLRAINNSLKEQLQAIKSKYENSSKASDKRGSASMRTQRDSEVAAATLQRDVAIKSLPEIPELPAKVKK